MSRIYLIFVGAIVGVIFGSILVSIALDIRLWNDYGLTLGFIIVQVLWAIIGGLCGWGLYEKVFNEEDYYE